MDREATPGGVLTAIKTCIAAGLSILFMAAAFNGVSMPQAAPLKSDPPRVVYTLPRRKLRDDFSLRAGTGEELRHGGETAEILLASQGVLLHPDLVTRMDRDATVRQYVQWTIHAAARRGLDGGMLANQYWQESKYNPDAHSNHGAGHRTDHADTPRQTAWAA